MKALIFLLFMCSSLANAQQQTYDVFTFTRPKGWKKQEQTNLLSFSTTNTVTDTWCHLGLVKSTASKGNAVADFDSEWQELVVKPYKDFSVSEQPLALDSLNLNGWKVYSGMSTFLFNNDTVTVALNVFSDGHRCASITMMSNQKGYAEPIGRFLESIRLPSPELAANNTQPTTSAQVSRPGTSGFAFNTSNFDDGWISVVKEDWVEVTRNNIKVLIHYPKEGTIFPADPDVLTNAAWNILVAPRYSNLRNYRTAYISGYIRPILGMGTVTDNASGKNVFVLLYRQGSTGWLEFVAKDRNSFIETFNFDPETIQWNSETDLMKPLERMVSYNKFAIADSDFTGTWTSDFTGVQQMYHVYTGNYAGMNITQSNEEFVFGDNNTYNWKSLLVHGMVGNQKASQVKSSGTFSVLNNWQLHFSKIESGPKTYHAYWSCIKGARLLNLLDANAPGSGIYSVYGKK